MKKIGIILLVLFSINSFAVSGIVKEVFCGEMDPFHVGDACLIELEDSNKKRVVVLYDFDYFLETHSEESMNSMIGKKLNIEANFIDDPELSIAMDFLGTDISFYSADVEGIILPVKSCKGHAKYGAIKAYHSEMGIVQGSDDIHYSAELVNNTLGAASVYLVDISDSNEDGDFWKVNYLVRVALDTKNKCEIVSVEKVGVVVE